MALRNAATGRFYAKPEPAVAPQPASRYRVTVFGRPRGPWRDSYDGAKQDAIDQDLAAWDASRREHFLAVPTDIEVNQGFGDRPDRIADNCRCFCGQSA